MKFIITVRHEDGSGEPWQEAYDEPSIKTREQAVDHGQELIDYFNRTLRPKEKRREFVSASLAGESNVHDWQKTNLVTCYKGGRSFDTMRCGVCGITGRRYGLGPTVERDDKYKAEKYHECPGPSKRVS